MDQLKQGQGKPSTMEKTEHRGHGPSKTQTMEDMDIRNKDHKGHGPSKILSIEKSNNRRQGPSKTWTKQ